MNDSSLKGRGIQIMSDRRRVVLKDYELVFNYLSKTFWKVRAAEAPAGRGQRHLPLAGSRSCAQLEPAFANIRPCEGSDVHGVLYSMPADQLKALDNVEGPKYKRRHVTVTQPRSTAQRTAGPAGPAPAPVLSDARAKSQVVTYEGETVGNVWAYVSETMMHLDERAPSVRYLKLVVDGAVASALAPDYVERCRLRERTRVGGHMSAGQCEGAHDAAPDRSQAAQAPVPGAAAAAHARHRRVPPQAAECAARKCAFTLADADWASHAAWTAADARTPRGDEIITTARNVVLRFRPEAEERDTVVRVYQTE
jgi:hypothetical protein